MTVSRRQTLIGILGLIAALVYVYSRSQIPAPTQPKLVATEDVVDANKQKSLSENPYSAPKVHDSKLAAIVDRNAKQRVTADISGKLREAPKEDFPALQSVLVDTEDSDTVRNEVANLLARSNDPGLANALIKVLDNPAEKPRFRAFATQHLGTALRRTGHTYRETALNKLHESLSDKDIEVRREALLALVRAKDPKGISTAVAWLSEQSDNAGNVRDVAIRCIEDLGLKEHVATIRQYVRDPNEVTRIQAIVTLSAWGDEESRPAFQEAAESKSVRLQRAGNAALKRLEAVKKAATGVG